VEMTFINELLLILPWWYITCTHKIDNIRVPGSDLETLKSMSSLIESLIGNSCGFSNCILDKWSATEFFTPFLSFISKSNSWSSKIHLINRGLASFLVSKYFKVAWSV
jgi:hypothetical protein